MNNWIFGLGALLLWKIFKLEQQVRSSEAAVIDIMEDIDETVATNIQKTAQHMGALYNENHYLGHQIDVLTLDYLHHLEEYGHYSYDKKEIVKAESYIVGAPSSTELEMEMKEDGLQFETRRLRGL